MTHLLLIDMDDFLIDASDLHYRTRGRYLDLLQDTFKDNPYSQEQNWDYQFLQDRFEELDHINMQSMKFSSLRYQTTMVQLYETLAQDAQHEIVPGIIDNMITIGSAIQYEAPSLIPGAVGMLSELQQSQSYHMALVTRGNPDTQNIRMNAHGLKEFFDDTLVVSHKDAATFRDIVTEFGFTAEDTCIMGDSIKSEILPALQIGAHAIYRAHHHPHYHWIQEHTESLPQQGVLVVQDLMQIPGLLRSLWPAP